MKKDWTSQHRACERRLWKDSDQKDLSCLPLSAVEVQILGALLIRCVIRGNVCNTPDSAGSGHPRVLTLTRSCIFMGHTYLFSKRTKAPLLQLLSAFDLTGDLVKLKICILLSLQHRCCISNMLADDFEDTGQWSKCEQQGSSQYLLNSYHKTKFQSSVSQSSACITSSWRAY